MNWGISATSRHREPSAATPLRADAWRGPLLAFAAPVALLLPFIAKPFHIDDPLFIWVAQQIAAHPLDFFGFDVNWMERTEPVYLANNNPPGLSYLLAAAGVLFGWSEPSMHAVMILIAGLTGLGVYLFAAQLCTRPLLAALLTIVTPGFFVSATTVMSDVPMVAAYVWAAYFWIRGLETENHKFLFAAAACMAASAMFKFYGITAVPLLAYYAIARKRRLGLWGLHLLVPIVALAVYEFWTWRNYGSGHLSAASQYSADATQLHTLSAAWNRVFMTLTFTGACMLPIALLGIIALPRRWIIVWAACAVAIGIYIFASDRVAYYEPAQPVLYRLQATIAAALGTVVALLTGYNCTRNRDAESLLLLCWIAGAIVFTAFFNHLINARTLLPLTPALAIVGLRIPAHAVIPATAGISIHHRNARLSRFAGATIAASAILSLALARADTEFARDHKSAAQTFADVSSIAPNRYFLGHWGFHYYLQREGWRSLDAESVIAGRTTLPFDTLIAVPQANEPQLAQFCLKLGKESSASARYSISIALIDTQLGAGFYSHQWGPLPFVFAAHERSTFTLYRIFADEPRGRP